MPIGKSEVDRLKYAFDCWHCARIVEVPGQGRYCPFIRDGINPYYTETEDDRTLRCKEYVPENYTLFDILK